MGFLCLKRPTLAEKSCRSILMVFIFYFFFYRNKVSCSGSFIYDQILFVSHFLNHGILLQGAPAPKYPEKKLVTQKFL